MRVSVPVCTCIACVCVRLYACARSCVRIFTHIYVNGVCVCACVLFMDHKCMLGLQILMNVSAHLAKVHYLFVKILSAAFNVFAHQTSAAFFARQVNNTRNTTNICQSYIIEIVHDIKPFDEMF